MDIALDGLGLKMYSAMAMIAPVWVMDFKEAVFYSGWPFRAICPVE